MFKKTNQRFRFLPILFALVCAVFSHAAWDGTYPDINAYTPSDTTIDGKKFYKIASEKDLAWFTMKVYRNGGKANYTNAIVTAPYLDMGAKWFLPIGAGDGTNAGKFSGIFDGNGATIANLIIDNDSLEGIDRQNSAFIGSLNDGGIIKNLIIENISVNARGNGDGLGFLLDGTIPSSIGTIVGWLANGTIENCYASGNIKTNGSNQRVGGIVGIGANGTIKNCLSVVDIDANGEREVFVGGIIGTVRRGSSVKIDGCAYDGKFITLHEGGATGKIIGKIETGTTINHTYFAKEGLAACRGDKPHTCNANGVDDLNTEEIACMLNAGTWDGHACSNATSNVWSTGVRITNKGVSRDDDGNTIFTISYDANGGQYAPGSPNPQKKYLKRNEKITGEGIPAPTKSGSVFVGWAKSSDATDPEDLGNVEKVVTVYAVWKDAITITFVDNYTDGHGKTPREPQEKVFAKGSEITATGIIAPEPYQFDDKKYFASGWAATSDGELLDPLGTADANKTLYTKWTAIDAERFTVTFKANGHGVAPETQAIVENNTATAPTAPVATGYTFKGWFTEAASTNAFDFSTPITEDMTLFAKWEPTPYTITYKFRDKSGDLADVDNSLNTATSYTIETNLALNAASKTGYTFKGWFKNAAFTERVTGISEGSTGNVTLYAQFEEIIYTIKYLSGKMGNGYIDNEYKHFDETITISTQKFMSPAQRQDGWTTVDMTGEKVYDFGDEYSTNDTLTLFPHWGDSILYTISYENMEGRPTPSPTTFYYNTTNAIILETPESDTVNFMGWYTEANFLNKINQLNPRTFGDTTVYAKWTAKLVFDGQGRAASSYREELPGTIIADPGAPSSAQAGFTFDKWYDDQDYTTEHDFSKPLTKNDTVYAKWISQEHKLHIDYVFPEGYVKPAGITEPAAVDSMVMYGTIYNIVSPKVTGHSPSLAKVYGTMELHDTTFTVTYTPNKYKISFMGSTSLIAECTMNYDYGTTPACEAPTKAATDDSTYTFSGWDPEIAMVTDVATYRATFTASPKKKKIIAYYGEGGSDYVHFLVPFESTDEEVEEKVDSVLKRRDYYPPQKAPTVETTYTFKDWSYGINPETGLLTFTPNFTESPREYAITFNGYNNKPITTINVAYGTVPEYEGTTPTKPEGIFYTYAFKAWTPEPVAVSSNATYTATFDSTAKTSVITVKYSGNDTDTLLVTVLLIDDEETVSHKVDSALAARNIELERAATDEYTYTFNKWQVKEAIQTGELTYIALFDSTRNAYEITFVDFDGTELKKVSLEYGRLPSYSPAPTRTETEDYTYTFTGWSPAIAAVTKKQTYTAQYDSSVKHIDVLVQYGEQPADTFTLTVGVSENIIRAIKNALAEKGITPEKASTDEYNYTYTGSWNETTEGEKTIYSPNFTATKRKYLITFINAGTTLKQESLEYGATPTCDTPSRKETAAFKYTFTGWTPAIATVTTQATYTAQYDSVVKFFDIVVKYGDKATDTLHLKADPRTDITEQIEAALASRNITPEKASTDEFEYTYANAWSVSNVNGQDIYSPVFTSAKRKYLISFVNAGTVVKKDSLEYGTRPSCENPTRTETEDYTYTFTGWSPTIAAVTKEQTYTAQYDSSVKHIHVFVQYGEQPTDTFTLTVGISENVTRAIKNALAEKGITPEKATTDEYYYTYTRSWNVTTEGGKTIYSPKFTATKRKYLITFINAGMTLKRDSLEYGVTPTCDTPSRKETTAFKYTFTGWTPAIATVTKEATYTAQYDSVFKFSDIVIKYGDKATDTLYLKVDSRTDITEQIEAALASKNITPAKASTDEFEYTYASEWSVSNVNGQAIYSPVFTSTKRKYLVSFENAGTVVKKDSLEYGTKPSCENPTRKETATHTYTFTGWSPAIAIVTKNATYTAEYDSVIKKVEIVVSYDSAKTDTIHVIIEVTDSASQIQEKIAEEFDKRRDIDLPTKEEDDKYIYTFETFVKTDSDIYVAQFTKEARTYAINYHLPRNGKLSEEVNTYTFGKTTLLPSAYIKNDSTWTFKGWYEKANGLGERYKAVKATETGDKNVYPLFQKSVTYKTKDTTGTVIVTYAGGDERNTIEQILSGIIPKDYDKDKKTYAFDRWVLEDGVYVAQYAEKVSIGARALAPSFSVTVHGRALEIFGAKIGAKIAIFDLSGRIILSGIVSNGTTHLKLPQSGSYVVRINNQAIRVTAK